MMSPLGAFVSSKLGGATASGAGIALTGLFTVITPLIIKWNLVLYLVVRFMEGIFEVSSI